MPFNRFDSISASFDQEHKDPDSKSYKEQITNNLKLQSTKDELLAASKKEKEEMEKGKKVPSIYTSRVPWKGVRDLEDPTIESGPPSPTWIRDNLTVRVLQVSNFKFGRLIVQIAEAPEDEGGAAESKTGMCHEFQTMLKKTFSESRVTPALSELVPGNHYLAMEISGSGVYMRRVRLSEIKVDGETTNIECWDIDRNVFFTVQPFSLSLMKDHVLNFPCQVFEVQISNLKLIWGTKGFHQALDDETKYLTEIGRIFNMTVDNNKEIPWVTMKSDGADIRERIIKRLRHICNVELPQIGVPTIIVVTHATVDGKICAHLEANKIFRRMSSSLEKVDPAPLNQTWDSLRVKTLKDLQTSTPNNPMPFFMAKYEGFLYRIKVLEIKSEQEISVLYIDYGNTNVVPLSEIFLLHKVDRTLVMIPPQCFTAQLNGIGYIDDMDFFWEQSPDRVYLTITSFGEEPLCVATVDIHKVVQGAEEPEDIASGDCINTIMLTAKKAFVSKPLPPPPPEIVEPAEVNQDNTVYRNLVPSDGNESDTESLFGDVHIPVIAEVEKQYITSTGNPSQITDGEGETGAHFTKLSDLAIAVKEQEKEAEIHHDPRRFVYRNAVSFFFVTGVFGSNNFAVQLQNHTGVVKEMEDVLARFYGNGNCDTERKLIKFKENVLCAYFYEAYQRWLRGLIVHVIPSHESVVLRVTIRLLDYGIWTTVLVNLENPSSLEKFRILPTPLDDVPPQGMTASQFMCPHLRNILDKDVLQSTRGCMIQAMVKDYLMSDKERDIPHVVLTILEVINSPKTKVAVAVQPNKEPLPIEY